MFLQRPIDSSFVVDPAGMGNGCLEGARHVISFLLLIVETRWQKYKECHSANNKEAEEFDVLFMDYIGSRLGRRGIRVADRRLAHSATAVIR